MIEYKGYTAHIEFDESIDTFVGRIANIRTVVMFEGKSIEELQREFAVSVEEYFALCKKLKTKPEPPYSGEIKVKIDPVLHRALADAAAEQGVSLDAFVAEKLKLQIRESRKTEKSRVSAKARNRAAA